MKLMKYPSNDLFPGFFEMENLFDRFFGRSGGSEQHDFLPAMDIASSEKEFLVTLELPGMGAEDIDIQVEKNILSVSGEKKSWREDKDRSYHRVERAFGKFNRKLRLPEDADSGRIEADFDRGVLKVRIARAEAALPKSIPVRNAAESDDEKKS